MTYPEICLPPSVWSALIPSLKAKKIQDILKNVCVLRKQGITIFPPQNTIFRALELTSPQAVRVVIIGQDPYHAKGQAHGLAFSVPEHMPCPRSLQNIFKEIRADIYKGAPLPCTSPNLERWAQQGILLLNTVLTVEEGKAHSHAYLGWQESVQDILCYLAQNTRPLAFLLWGKPAQKYVPLIQSNSIQQHLILTAAHPSPLSAARGFYGCKHFSKVNTWLLTQKEKPIVW